MKDIQTVITDLEFTHDIEFPTNQDATNPKRVQDWIEYHSDIDMSELAGALEDFHAREAAVSQDEIKEVFAMLKARTIHPRGSFDKQGAFLLGRQ